MIRLFPFQTSRVAIADFIFPKAGEIRFIGATFVLSPAMQVNRLVFYGANFGDGGWFGTNGVGPSGAGSTLAATNLIAPTLQYTTNGGVSWVNDAAVTNDYVAQFTGTAAGGGASTNPATFTPTAPLTGINGLRLIGQDGGYASGGGGFWALARSRSSPLPCRNPRAGRCWPPDLFL